MHKSTIIPALLCVLISLKLSAQDIKASLDRSVSLFLKDEQMQHASMGFFVLDGSTGEPIYDFDAQKGLAPASTQKIFTSIASFDLLGRDFRYKTEIGYRGSVSGGILKGDLIVSGYGDPTLGSWRFEQTKRDTVLGELVSFIKKGGIKKIEGNLILDDSRFSYQPLPGGWIWEDLGNYYGAGSWAINWNENQYDLLLRPGTEKGKPVTILSTVPDMQLSLLNQLKTGAPGSGDNGYIYLPPYGTEGFTEGTEAASDTNYTISGAMPDPPAQFGTALEKALRISHIGITGKILTGASFKRNKKQIPQLTTLLGVHYSPRLDSIVFWFLRKSINLYGEALAKTLAFENSGKGSTEAGVALIRAFWKEKGIENSALQIQDGSGLSPQNRVTPFSEVKALEYAQAQPWFPAFYSSLPSFNGMKMKSGSIGGSRAFTGYQTSQTGKKYIFSLIINNYSGSPELIVKKMYTLLNELK